MKYLSQLNRGCEHTYTGRLDFVKIGAAPSFIKRGREVENYPESVSPSWYSFTD